MSVTLISLEGREDIPLDRVLTVVGRHHCCDARIDSSRVSRRHCCLALDSEGVLVRDLGSTNGTRVNGLRVEDGLLRPGDELTIAYSRYRLVIRDAPAAAGLPADRGRRPPVSPSRPPLAAGRDDGGRRLGVGQPAVARRHGPPRPFHS